MSKKTGNTVEVKLTSAVQELQKGIHSANYSLNGLKGNVKLTTSAIDKMKTSAKSLTASLKNLGNSLYGNFISKAIDYTEELNLFNVVFKNIEKNGKTSFSKIGKEATKFQNKLNESFGTNKMETMRYQALFQSMGLSAGLSDDIAAKMSENMTKLGMDLSSLFNTTETKAMESLRAGVYAGQTKPLRNYGIDVTQNSMKPILAELGIEKSINQLSQAEKEILRYISALRQARQAMGDFANTIESPANQLKVFKSQMIELGVVIGSFFVGVRKNAESLFGSILQYINGIIMAVKSVLKFLLDIFGIELADFNAGLTTYGSDVDDYADGLDGVSDSANGAANAIKKLNRQTLAFDQINNINSPTPTSSGGSSGGGGGVSGEISSALLDAIGEYDNQMEKVRMKAVQIRDTIMEWLGFTRMINEETSEVSFSYDVIGKSSVQIATEWGTNLANGINGALQDIIDSGAIEQWGKNLGNAINTALAFVNNFVGTFDWKKLASSFANFLNSAIKETDFSAIGIALTNKIKIAIESLLGFATTFDWAQLGQKIGDLINGAISNISASDLAQGINALVNGLFTAIKEAIKRIKWAELASEIAELWSSLDWKVKLLVVGKVIGAALNSSIGTALKGSLLQSLTSSITSSLLPKLTGALKTVAMKAATTAFSVKMNFASSGFFGGILETAKGVFSGLSSSLAGLASTAGIVIGAIVLAVAGFVNAYKEGGNFKNIVDKLKTAFEKLWGAIKAGWEKVKPLFDALKAVIKVIWDLIMDVVELVESQFLNQMATGISLIADVLTLDFKGALEDAKSFFVDWGKSIGGFFADVLDTVGLDSWGEGLRSALNIESEAEKAKEDIAGVSSDLIEWRDRLSESAAEGLKKAQENYGQVQVEVDNLVGRLGTLIDSNGKIKQGYEDEAKVLSGELSDALGQTIELRNGHLYIDGQMIKNQEELTLKTGTYLAELKKRIYLESQEETYKAILQKIAEKQQNLNNITQAYQDKKAEIIKKYGEESEKGKSELTKLESAYTQLAVGARRDVAAAQNELTNYNTFVSNVMKGDYEAADKYIYSLSNDSKKEIEDSKKKIEKNMADLGSRIKDITDDPEKNMTKFAYTAQTSLDSIKAPTFDLRVNLPSQNSLQQQFNGYNLKIPATITAKTNGKAMGGILKNGRWQDIEGYANGGAPASAQFFYARENGLPELVGRIGRSTAVMNNDQIVNSVKNGVYEAVMAAMSNGGSEQVDIHLHTDAGIVVDNINKITRRTGTCPINF